MSEPDIKQSKAEKINADIGFQKKKFFAKNYDPLNLMEFDDASSAKIEKAMTGRAAADSMQALTQNLAFNPNRNTTNMAMDGAANLNRAYLANVNAAQKQAKQFQNKREAGALGVATGQSADNSRSMALLARLGASEAISGAKADQIMQAGIMQGGAALAGNIITDKAHAFRESNPGEDNWATRMSDFLRLGA